MESSMPGESAPPATPKVSAGSAHPRLITGLADLPAKAMLDEDVLAQVLVVSKRTIRRMVARFELPPPIALAGRSTWIADRVLAHIEARAECAARKAELEARRIEALPYKFTAPQNSPEVLQEPAATPPK